MPKPEAPSVKRVVFSFHGTFETQAGVVFARCDHAPLIARGADEDEALERMEKVISAYVRALASRGEIELAVQTGKLRADLASIPADPTSLAVSRSDGRFTAELAAA